MLIWLGFFLSIALLMLIARKSLWIALTVAAIILGSFSLSVYEIGEEILNTLTDSSILLLALSVGMIPMIGGVMETSGLMDDLVENLRMKKRLFLAFSPALMGMLPMPGGALLSAPIIKKGGKGVSNDRKSAVNVWFRHLLLLIYPLGALLATTKMAGLDLYLAILYLIPGFLLMLVLGYLFLLRDVEGKIEYGRFKPKKLAIALGIILAAPLIHLSLMMFDNAIPEVYLLIGVSISLALALYFGRTGLNGIKNVSLKMKPWNFALIIIGMFLFLNIFEASDTPGVIASLAVSKAILLVVIGAILGFATGRVQVPVSILLPIYFSKYGVEAMMALPFALMFFSIFMGYIISPVHPCISVSLEYFRSSFKDFLKNMMIPTAMGLFVAFIFAMIFL